MKGFVNVLLVLLGVFTFASADYTDNATGFQVFAGFVFVLVIIAFITVQFIEVE